MGVDIIYNPFSKVIIVITFIFIVSCTPVNNHSSEKVSITNYSTKPQINFLDKKQIQKKTTKQKSKDLVVQKSFDEFANQNLLNKIEIILPRYTNENITKHLINSFELSIYKKEIDNTILNINRYTDLKDLENILNLKAKPGKIFIGTLNINATKLIKQYCSKGILFFSFAFDKSIADECVYLINFFPEDDLHALFNFFPADSKIALLYPENFYGHNINKIIDPIASKSKSLIINKVAYKEDLTNARDSIKELGKYELRRHELERQKKILKNKNDEISKKALKKIKKYETAGNVDFTHLILPDYSIRLLEIAPLLPFYDVDPNKIQFVGTGVWDDTIFFNEPSLQGAIFSGIEEEKRKDFFSDYEYIYQEKPIRTATIPYDLMGIISYIIDNKMTVRDVYKLLDDGNIKFDGIDGKFFFINNSIFRELDILKINNGRANKLN